MGKKVLAIFIALLFTMIMLVACKDFDDSYEGLSIGFNYSSTPNGIECGIRSKKNTFDVNEITLDFYYGSLSGSMYCAATNYEPVCMAVYLYNQLYKNEINYFTTDYEDYTVIKGHILVNEITGDDFNSEMFSVKISMTSGKAYQYCETLTVPRDLLEVNGSRIGLLVIEVYKSKNGRGYCLGESGFVEAKYDFVNDNTVMLSKPDAFYAP